MVCYNYSISDQLFDSLDRKSLSITGKLVHFNQNIEEDDDDYDILMNEIGKDDNPRFVDLEKLHFFLILCGNILFSLYENIVNKEFSRLQQEKILRIVSSKQNEKGLILKEEVKKILKKSPPIDSHTFSSDNMSDIFDFIASTEGTPKNFIDLATLKQFAKEIEVEFNEKNDDEELKSMLGLVNKQNSTGKITKPEFIKLRNFLD